MLSTLRSGSSIIWFLLLFGTGWALLGAQNLNTAIWFLVLITAFFAGSRLTSLDKLLAGFGVLLCLSSAVAIGQLLGWRPLPAVNVPSAFFYNKEVFAELAAPVAVWWLLKRPFNFVFTIGAVLPLLLCRERAAIGTALVGLLYGWRREWWAKIPEALIAGLFVVSMLLYSPERWLSAQYRFEIWKETAANISLFGHGLGWFKTAFPYYGFAHSDILQMLVEFGVGAILFFAIPSIILIQWLGSQEERAVLVTICALASVSFLFEMPLEGFLAATVLGHLATKPAHLFQAKPSPSQ